MVLSRSPFFSLSKRTNDAADVLCFSPVRDVTRSVVPKVPWNPWRSALSLTGSRRSSHHWVQLQPPVKDLHTFADGLRLRKEIGCDRASGPRAVKGIV